MTDQAVDTGGVKLSEDTSTEGQFLGRARELKELRADIERAGLDTIAGRKAPRARVLLIAGKPGSGRSALAGELARQVADRYEGGVLRARLSEPDGTPVPTERTARELLTALELPTPAGASEDDLSDILREALTERRVLLLLDDAADAEQVDALLPDSPDCLVVAVSGGPLTGIADVRPCTLGGLDTKSALELLTRYTGAVRITVDPVAAEGLVEVCQAQPAALTLAGGWLAARPQAAVADLAKHLHAETDEGTPSAASSGSSTVPCRAPPPGYCDCSPSPRPAWSTRRPPPRSPAAPSTAPAPPWTTSPTPACCGPWTRRSRSTRSPAASSPSCAPSPRPRTARPNSSWPAPACWSAPYGCSSPAVPSPRRTARRPARNSSGRPARCASRPPAAADWLSVRRPALLASARLAVADGELDTLARRLMSQLVRAMVAHVGTQAAAPELYGIHRLVLDVAERRTCPARRPPRC